MVGRKTLEAELERDLATKPFETYELFRGQKFGGDGGDGSGGDYREVGRFKVCRVLVSVLPRYLPRSFVCLMSCV